MTPGSELPQIVVADDDLLLSSRVSAALERLGYRAVVVRSAAALETALGDGPHAVIVNLAARRFDAQEAIRRIKGEGTTRAIPLLGFCGHREAERARAAVAAGCDAVTTNGVIAADLSRALQALLDSARLAPGTT